jgi:hypothetical protein
VFGSGRCLFVWLIGSSGSAGWVRGCACFERLCAGFAQALSVLGEGFGRPLSALCAVVLEGVLSGFYAGFERVLSGL